MAYFSSSNYEQYYDNNYQFYQPYYNDNVDYDTQESRYVQYDYNDHTQYYNNEFQVAPSQSLVGYYCSNNNNNDDDFFASKNANFHENGDYYYDPVSTQFVISYNISEKEANDLVYKEYNPEPYHGGYDINETYGKALPPSIDICYPPTKINPNLSVPLPYGKEEPKLEAEPKPETNLIGSDEDEDEDEDFEDEDEDEDDGKQEILQNVEGEEKPKSILVLEENVIDSEEDEDEDEDEDENDGKQEILQNVEGEVKPKSNLVLEENVIDSEEDEDEDEDQDEDEDEDEDEETFEGGKEDIASKVPPSKEEGNRGNEDGYGKEIRRQITPGYGMEAIDICEGLFGGYFPCLLKKNKGGLCKQCGGSGVKLRNMDEYECWQGTVDYFFGNPNPYGGSMPEKGSYGDPMLSYQRYYPQESIVGEVKYEENENENSSWLLDYSRYNYGHN